MTYQKPTGPPETTSLTITSTTMPMPKKVNTDGAKHGHGWT